MLKHGQMEGYLKIQVLETIENDQRNYSYEVFSELAVTFATKMDDKYKEMFFDKFLNKFVSDLGFLDDEIMYKILWSCIRADRFVGKNDAY